MVGYLYELVGQHQTPLRYATIWTDATIAPSFNPAVTHLVQTMAQMQTSPPLTAGSTTTQTSTPPVTLLAGSGAA